MLLGWYGELFSQWNGSGYHTARKGLFNMMRAFAITVREPAARNAAFELRVLHYLSAIADAGPGRNQLWAWIERGEGFMDEPPVLDDFRAALAVYTSEQAGTNAMEVEATPDVLPVERQMGQLALDQPPAEDPVATVATAHVDAMVQRQEDYLLGVGHLNDNDEILESFRVLLARWYEWLPHIRNNLRRLLVLTVNMMLTGMGYRLKDHVLQFLALAGTADPELNTYIRERRDFSSFLPTIRNHLNNAMSRDEFNGAGAAAARLLVQRFS